jgi:alpha-1,2-mannosyltransferase
MNVGPHETQVSGPGSPGPLPRPGMDVLARGRALLKGPAVTLLSAGSVLLGLGFAFFSTYHRMVPVDLEVYLMGGHHAFAPDLYTVLTPDLRLPFTYPPFAALLFVPLEPLPFGLVEGFWAVLIVGSLVAVAAFSLRMFGVERVAAWRWACVLSLPFLLLEPPFEALTLGQVDLGLLALLLWDLGGFRRTGPRTLPEGLLTGLTAAIKLTPLIFVPYLLLVRRTRAGLTCAATFLACQCATFAASPSSSWQYWSKYVLDTSRFPTLYISINQSVLAAMGRFAHRSLPDAVGLGASAVAAVLGVLLAAWAYRRSSPQLGFLVCGAASLLASPVTWTHHMVWVIPVIVWLAIGVDRPRAGRWLAAATAVLFWASPVSHVPETTLLCPCVNIVELHENAWQLLAGNSFFLGTALFLVGVTVMLRVRSTASAKPEL